MDIKDKLAELIGQQKPYQWAKECGISPSSFHFYWRKGGMPSAVNLRRIVRHTGCDMNWLLENDDDR